MTVRVNATTWKVVCDCPIFDLVEQLEGRADVKTAMGFAYSDTEAGFSLPRRTLDMTPVTRKVMEDSLHPFSKKHDEDA